MKLTENQVRFIADNFFRHPEYAGWTNIAEKLISNGECIVAGTNCIWNGGIGNFIETESEDNLEGCLRYKFNIKSFIQSPMFQESWSAYVIREQNRLNKEQALLNEINSIKVNE